MKNNKVSPIYLVVSPEKCCPFSRFTILFPSCRLFSQRPFFSTINQKAHGISKVKNSPKCSFDSSSSRQSSHWFFAGAFSKLPRFQAHGTVAVALLGLILTQARIVSSVPQRILDEGLFTSALPPNVDFQSRINSLMA